MIEKEVVSVSVKPRQCLYLKLVSPTSRPFLPSSWCALYGVTTNTLWRALHGCLLFSISFGTSSTTEDFSLSHIHTVPVSFDCLLSAILIISLRFSFDKILVKSCNTHPWVQYKFEGVGDAWGNIFWRVQINKSKRAGNCWIRWTKIHYFWLISQQYFLLKFLFVTNSNDYPLHFFFF